MSSEKSYAQILKASSIMGGAAGVNLLLGMVRVKFAAVLIGATGVGLNASFGALQGLVGTLAGLGIQSSAVRDIAVAVGKGDQQAIGRAVLTLRRVCWLTGLVGMAAMMLLSSWLSQLTFGHRDYAIDIAALGLIILFANLSGGQMALIQGMRRIGDMAKANIFGAAAATVAAIGFYSALGLRGIVPALVSVAAIQLALTWYFARQVSVPQVQLSIRQTLNEARGMVRLGLVMMSNGLMGSAVTYVTITLITLQEGVQAVGLYSAAFALSGMFANFVLGAMGGDYYPRLTGVAHDKAAMNRMVNEQTEVGLLLALPGLLVTMALAPWILPLFYSHEFLSAVELLQWFILGCVGRVISWPLGYIMLALGKSKWLIASEALMHLIHTILIYTGLRAFGLTGVAQSFALLYLIHICVTLLITKKLTNFQWKKGTAIIILTSTALTAIAFLSSLMLEKDIATVLGLIASAIAVTISTLTLIRRTNKNSAVTASIDKIFKRLSTFKKC